MKSRLLTIVIRGFSQLLKFLLLVFIAKNYALSDVGIYGIFASSIVIATYFIGFDFYTYSQREILKDSGGKISNVIFNHFFFVLFIYMVGVPLNYLLFYFKIIPKHLVLIYFLILFFELVSQESYRILIALNLQVEATILFFLKGGFWILVFFASLIVSKQLNPDFIEIFYFWLFGTLISVLFGFIYLYKHSNYNNFSPKINFNWIKNGILVAFPFLISTLFFKVLFSFDRYCLNYFFSKEIVGIYTFFIGISNIVITFVEAGAVIHTYPNLVKFYKRHLLNNYYMEIKKLSLSIIVLSVLIIVVLVVFIKPLLIFIDKPDLIKELNLFWLLLLAMFLLNLSNIPHYIGYAKDQDKFIIISTIMSSIVTLVGYYVLVPYYSFFGVAVSLIIGFFLMFVLKLIKNYKDIILSFK